MFGKRNSDRNTGSFAQTALHSNRSVMLIDGPLHEAESEAGAIRSIGSGGVSTIETFKDVGKGLGGNTDAVVTHFENRILGTVGDANLHVAAGWCEFDGVVDNV